MPRYRPLFVAAVLAACRDAERGPVEVRLAAPDTIVTSESEVLALPADLAVDGAGHVYVADAQNARVAVFAARGEQRFIGREGRGPGELKDPLHLGLAGDTVRVASTGNLRVAVYTTAGAFVRSDPLPPSATAAPLSFAPDGRIAIATYGIQDSVLARVLARDGTVLKGVGELLAPGTDAFYVTAIKEEAEKGNVPAVFRNHSQPLFAADGGVWVVLTAEGVLRRYERDGRLLWSVSIEAPELSRIKQAFFDRSRELAGQPARFAMLRYLDDAQVVGDDLWILLNTAAGEPSVILVFDDQGSQRRRLVIPGVEEAGAFAVDAARKRLYVTTSDAGLLRFDVPGR